jgi:hypothetical protein
MKFMQRILAYCENNTEHVTTPCLEGAEILWGKYTAKWERQIGVRKIWGWGYKFPHILNTGNRWEEGPVLLPSCFVSWKQLHLSWLRSWTDPTARMYCMKETKCNVSAWKRTTNNTLSSQKPSDKWTKPSRLLKPQRVFSNQRASAVSTGEFVCLFSRRYNPLWLYFHSPVAGFSLLVFEVSWTHTTTRHSR